MAVGGASGSTTCHTCASLRIQAGATPVEVQRILGHCTSATTLNLYTHLLPDALDGAAAKLDGYLDGRLRRPSDGLVYCSCWAVMVLSS